MRLDKWLVEKQFASSREKAKELLLKNAIHVNGKICCEASRLIQESDNVIVDTSVVSPYISRAAEKLLAALYHFKLSVEGKKILDVGMSTGGFTQVLLLKGADHVVGVDVGHDQLHPSLRVHPKVTCYEGVNVKEGLPFKEKFPFIVVDVSFISLHKILHTLIDVLDSNATMLLLVKPQFEQTKDQKKLVLSEKQSWEIAGHCVSGILKMGLKCSELFPVPLKGKDGNLEFFVTCKKLLS